MRNLRILLTVALFSLATVPAKANPAAAAVGKWALQQVAGKAFDELWDAATGKPDVRAIQSRLETAERVLAQAGRDIAQTNAEMSTRYADMASQLSKLRQEMNENTSRERIEGIVRDVLGKMEQRVDRIEIKVDEIATLFRFLPTVTPAPLLADRVAEGDPAVHPLMAEYARLLVQCETSRLEIARLRQLFQDTAPELAPALQKDRAILAGVTELNQKANAELAKLLPDREALLQTHKPAHPVVREMDSRLASIAWLCGITRPLADGPDKGRLPVPRDLLGPRCSDMLIAFDLSAVKPADLTPLFRQLLTLPVEGSAGGEKTVAMPAALTAHIATGSRLVQSSEAGVASAHQIQAGLQTALRDLSPTHPDVLKLLAEKKQALLQTSSLHATAELNLNTAIADYVTALRQTRPTAAPMLQFRSGTLQPLAKVCALTAGADAAEFTARDDCWKRLLGTPASFTNTLGMKFVSVPGTSVLFCIHETRSKDFAAFIADRNRGYNMTGDDADDWRTYEFKGVPVGRGASERAEDSIHPAANVSWLDAVAFCEWLSKKEGKTYRLPTDREWSVAVGIPQEPAGSPRDLDAKLEDVYPWGGKFVASAISGNYCDAAAKAKFPDFTVIEGYRDGFATTAPVMSFKTNQHGLYDMGGNLWEWVAGCYDGTDLQGKDKTLTSSRALRGGSWSDFVPALLLSSRRGDDVPGFRLSDFGFRCVVVGSGG